MIPEQAFERELIAGTALSAAPALLGSLLLAEDGLVLRIVEVEAYGPSGGVLDPASHAHRGRTERNAAMFAEPGTAYVYRSYGIHLCLNVACDRAGVGAAVLIRSAEVVRGHDLARARRPRAAGELLASGPGNLGLVLGARLVDSGLDLLDPSSRLRLVRGPAPRAVRCGPRVGISRAADRPWRFWDADSVSVSRYRRSSLA